MKIELLRVEAEKLNENQKKIVQEADLVFDINCHVGTKKISNFGDGELTIQIPYSGSLPVAVWHLNDAGKLEKMTSSYANGMVTFQTDHLSLYVLRKDTTIPTYTLSRLQGSTRYGTAVALSQTVFEKADTVILASGQNFPDALAAISLAKQYDGPILLTQKDQVPQEILDEIQRLGAEKIILVGGKNTISSEVVKQLKGLVIDRIEGRDRYQTALKIAESFVQENKVTQVVIADGRNYPDALAVGAYSAKNNAPILLTNGSNVDDILAFLNKHGIKNVIIVGGSNSVSNEVEKALQVAGISEERVSGADRYETATKLAKLTYPDSKKYLVGNGTDYPDALVAGMLSYKTGAPLLLTKPSELPKVVCLFLEETITNQIIIIGGSNSVNENVFK